MAKEWREFLIWVPGGALVGAIGGYLFEPLFGFWPLDAGLGSIVGGLVGFFIAVREGSH